MYKFAFLIAGLSFVAAFVSSSAHAAGFSCRPTGADERIAEVIGTFESGVTSDLLKIETVMKDGTEIEYGTNVTHIAVERKAHPLYFAIRNSSLQSITVQFDTIHGAADAGTVTLIDINGGLFEHSFDVNCDYFSE